MSCKRSVLIEVLAINGSDHGDHRGEKQEAAVAFVSFDDEIFAFAEAGSGAGLIHPATDDKCGVEMRGSENRGDQRSGRGLAVRAGDGDAVFQAHQFSQHFGTRNHWNFPLVRFDHFGIVGFDGRRNDHDVRAFDVGGFVAFVNRGAEILQTFRDA